ncbi:hypothetical protein DL95DRAFT_404017 [Leptodontidium sp. 2 PMI_412]|nr:hypothetical protein DL95DRAFT_404017 [Leptodontidium sp. 2 PMI_412]
MTDPNVPLRFRFDGLTMSGRHRLVLYCGPASRHDPQAVSLLDQYRRVGAPGARDKRCCYYCAVGRKKVAQGKANRCTYWAEDAVSPSFGPMIEALIERLTWTWQSSRARLMLLIKSWLLGVVQWSGRLEVTGIVPLGLISEVLYGKALLGPIVKLFDQAALGLIPPHRMLLRKATSTAGADEMVWRL